MIFHKIKRGTQSIKTSNRGGLLDRDYLCMFCPLGRNAILYTALPRLSWRMGRVILTKVEGCTNINDHEIYSSNEYLHKRATRYTYIGAYKVSAY